MLLNCNALSSGRIKEATEDYKKHKILLVDMTKDLNYIFQKIRTIKAKLSIKYPEAFEKVEKEAQKTFDEGDEAEPEEEIVEKEKVTDLSLGIESSVNYVAMDKITNNSTDSSSS